jgi:hypothetical protein
MRKEGVPHGLGIRWTDKHGFEFGVYGEGMPNYRVQLNPMGIIIVYLNK